MSDYCSISFISEDNIISKKLCLNNENLNKLNIDPKYIETLEKKYNSPFEFLKNIPSSNIKEDIKFNNLKPIAPVDKYSWLNNLHLDQIQEHFKRYFKCYYYSCIHMSDLVMFKHENDKFISDDVKQIKEIDFAEEIKNNENFKYYGVIFNTDTSNKSGQHWFSIFMDFTKKGDIKDPYTIEYFNSAGTRILPNLYKFFINLAFEISNKLKKICSFVEVTKIQHQAPNTGNCGVYSLFYIFSRLNGVPYTEFNDHKFKIDDDLIVEIRKLLFVDKNKV